MQDSDININQAHLAVKNEEYSICAGMRVVVENTMILACCLLY